MNEVRHTHLESAREAARAAGLRERVVCYVTRAGRDLLLFDHTPEHPDAGVQVPGGGVDAGEHPRDAARRETFEESGLTALGAPVYLASRSWSDANARQMRHFYWLRAPEDAPDAWPHVVTSDGADGGLTFLHRFTPLRSARPDWDTDAELPALRAALTEEHA